MKRLPKSVKIGPHDYEVVQQAKVYHEDGEQCNAVIQIDLLRILMERGLKRQKKQEHILHECTHGIFEGFPFEDDELEEKLVTFIAPKLLQLLRDNPELISYLTT